MKVYYIGPEGSRSHTAALSMFRSQERSDRATDDFIARSTYKEVFEEMDKDISAIGVVPIEDAWGGDVHGNLEELFSGKYKIAREFFLQIRHNLLTLPKAKISDIKKVLLHPQSRLQCSNFLSQYPNWKQVIVPSSSEGAKVVSEGDDISVAALGSLRAAEIYGLKILKKSIGNEKDDTTRFSAVIRELADFPPGNADKCSVIFELPHRKGSLYTAIKALYDQKYNLTKIESRLIPGEDEKYIFFLDFIFHDLLDLSEFEKATQNMKIVGIYKQGKSMKE